MLKKLLLINAALRLACYAQKVVTGKLQGDKNSPPDVSILLKGSSMGTASDSNGGYSSCIPQPLLLFSFIGFEQPEQPVGVPRRHSGLTAINYRLFNHKLYE